eukprot:TRINITY_DN7366_c0_g1_i2.p1 TRINITY_DN7366_c0_g1~~TRINITY_DN7366_c0_g1_i2.p1  ORF type:complete len:326 (-),score=67.60 TRINITY_DN7366_c0_g1_i2:398-1375(-)
MGAGTIFFLAFAIMVIIGAVPMYVVFIILSLCMAFVVYLVMNQESVLYIPVIQGFKTPNDNPPGHRSPREHGLEYEDVYLPLDGIRIHGWYMPAPTAETEAPTLLFCHENAGNIGLRLEEAKVLHRVLRANVFFFDYRGYGFSEGIPSEEGLVRDGFAALRWLYKRAEEGRINRSRIFLTGRSLGGAVAIQMAAQISAKPDGMRPAGVIIENTFTCIEEMVGSVFPPLGWAVKWSPFLRDRCLRLKWRSIDAIGEIELPILMLSSTEDEIVPAAHMTRLKAAAKGTHHCVVETFKATHNDIWAVAGEKYWLAKRNFLAHCSNMQC